MSRPLGGYIGFTPTPTTAAASGVWTLREFARAEEWPQWTPPPPVTFYFVNWDDNNWSNLNNWFMDDELMTTATSLPTQWDNVIARGQIGSNGGSEPTVLNFTLEDDRFEEGGVLDIDLTVTGLATISQNSYIEFENTLTGNAAFTDSALNSAVVTGNATFSGSSENSLFGVVGGNATFGDGTTNYGTVDGDATFGVQGTEDAATNAEAGTIKGNATFNGFSQNVGTVEGDATFNDEAGNISTGEVLGNATFNDDAYNQAIIRGDASFGPNTCNSGTVDGAITGSPPAC